MGHRLLNLPRTYLCQEENCYWAKWGHIPHVCEQMLRFGKGNRRRGLFIQGGHLIHIR